MTAIEEPIERLATIPPFAFGLTASGQLLRFHLLTGASLGSLDLWQLPPPSKKRVAFSARHKSAGSRRSAKSRDATARRRSSAVRPPGALECLAAERELVVGHGGAAFFLALVDAEDGALELRARLEPEEAGEEAEAGWLSLDGEGRAWLAVGGTAIAVKLGSRKVAKERHVCPGRLLAASGHGPAAVLVYKDAEGRGFVASVAGDGERQVEELAGLGGPVERVSFAGPWLAVASRRSAVVRHTGGGSEHCPAESLRPDHPISLLQVRPGLPSGLGVSDCAFQLVGQEGGSSPLVCVGTEDDVIRIYNLGAAWELRNLLPGMWGAPSQCCLAWPHLLTTAASAPFVKVWDDSSSSAPPS